MDKNKKHVLNEDLFQHMLLEEGLRTKPYLDTQGIPTIAIGNTRYPSGERVTMKDRQLTKAQAIGMGRLTICDFAEFVNHSLEVELTKNQFNACVSLCYNIGKHGFANSTALKLINKNPNDARIHPAFMLWTKNPELKPRRLREANLYFQK